MGAGRRPCRGCGSSGLTTSPGKYQLVGWGCHPLVRSMSWTTAMGPLEGPAGSLLGALEPLSELPDFGTLKSSGSEVVANIDYASTGGAGASAPVTRLMGLSGVPQAVAMTTTTTQSGKNVGEESVLL